MGIFGWMSRKVKAVTSAISNAIKSTGRAISSGYKSFTGQATFEEADKMYEDIKCRFEAHKAYFEKEVDNLSSQIEAQVKSINSSKATIKIELFPTFAEKMKQLNCLAKILRLFLNYMLMVQY